MFFAADAFLAPWRHRFLFWQMTRRDVAQRHRGSLLGGLWPILTPLLHLGVYVVVFGFVFQMRWPGFDPSDKISFAVVLFCGLSAHQFLSDCLNRAPMLVAGSPNYVKRVVFPLELLAWSMVGSALFQAGLNVAVLIVAAVIAKGVPPLTALLLPVVWAPMVIFALGASWLLAAVGVFFRDLGQIMNFVSMVMLFGAPVLYPADSAPQWLRLLLQFNPLTQAAEGARAVLLQGHAPDWTLWGAHLAGALLLAFVGATVFHRLRRAFADVV